MSRIQNRVEGTFFKRLQRIVGHSHSLETDWLRFPVSLGFVVEIDPAFVARRTLVMNGKLIPRSFGAVRHDNLVSRRPRAIWRGEVRQHLALPRRSRLCRSRTRSLTGPSLWRGSICPALCTTRGCPRTTSRVQFIPLVRMAHGNSCTTAP